jgi:hypothetical protein
MNTNNKHTNHPKDPYRMAHQSNINLDDHPYLVGIMTKNENPNSVRNPQKKI